MQKPLEGHVALVTGGGQGIGAAVALDLAGHGAHVAICDLQAGGTAEVLKGIEQQGQRGLFLQADVTDLQRAFQVVEEVKRYFARLDILVNNAGINQDAVIWKMTEDQWDRVLAVDLKGYFNYARAVSPLFRATGSGKIVNITSINGLRGKVGQVNYSAAKAGVVGLTKALAKELARYQVNVNAVAPGYIQTPMTKAMPEEAQRAAVDEIPLGRPGLPEDVAAVVTFLCTERARHITGEVIKVDGGQYI